MPAGDVRDAHRGVRGVHALPAGARRAEHVDSQILVLDLHVDFFGFRKHRDSRRRRMDAPLVLRRGHALHAMDAALPSKPAEHAVAFHLEDRFLDPAECAVGVRDGLDAPPAMLRVARVHAIEIGREERGLVATGARADLDDCGAIIEWIARQEQRRELGLDVRDALGEARLFRARFRGHLRVVYGNELARLRELALVFPKLVGQLLYRGQPPVLSPQLGESPRIAPVRSGGELAFYLIESGERLFQPIEDAQAGFPYFWRKRSTRPAVSISFCLPV